MRIKFKDHRVKNSVIRIFNFKITKIIKLNTKLNRKYLKKQFKIQ